MLTSFWDAPRCVHVCVCVQYISKRQKDELSNTSLLQARFLTKKQLLCWILPIALPMPTLLPSLHYSLSWEAEKKNCICRLPDMLLQLCLDEWGTGGHEGKEDSKCIDCLDCHSPRSHCASPGNFLFASLVLGYWYLLFSPILQDLQQLYLCFC